MVQHRRGDLSGTAPNYTGITNIQQTEGFSFVGTGNWLTNSTTSPSFSWNRPRRKAGGMAIPSSAGVCIHRSSLR